MSDFQDVDRLISQTQSDLRQADNLCRQVDSTLSYDRSTIMNPSWMDTKYPLPQSKDTSSGQLVDAGQGRPASTGSSYAGSYGGQTDVGEVCIFLIPVLGAIVGALVGSDSSWFYGFIGAVVGSLIGFALSVIGSVIYLILSFIFDS